MNQLDLRPRGQALSGMPGASPSDAEGEALLDALRRQDPAAVERLVREQTPRMLAVARRMLRNEEDARDAVQDAFLCAFRSLDGFEQASALSTWLHRIVVNAALMKLRTRRRRPEESIEPLLPQFLEDGHHASNPREWMPADALLERRETRELVRAAIDRLPESYRTILLLRDIEEMDTEETGRALDLTPAAVKVRLHRARQALRTLLDPAMRARADC
jgi:RNA polymerase sigma-70 factor, ECF subfamily